MAKVRKFDLVVIGTGAAGAVVAHKCRGAGWSVAIIDSRPYGGTCALRGCDPKKVLMGVAEAVDSARRLTGRGARAESLRIDSNRAHGYGFTSDSCAAKTAGSLVGSLHAPRSHT